MKNKDLRTLRNAPIDLPDVLRDVIEYRKSGLSLNHVVGCPLDCGYCVRHLFDNYDMKKPHLIMEDDAAVRALLEHWAFQPNITPIQIFNRATDPFLPIVKEHLFRTLESLDNQKLSNKVLVITRWKVEPEDVERLERLSNISLTILVTWSGITDNRIEPVDSDIAANSIAVLKEHALKTKFIFYFRPIIAGLNDDADTLARARELGALANATVFTGLFFREEIRRHFRLLGVDDLYEEVARRKIFPGEIEKKIIDNFNGQALFRKTSCGVGFVHSTTDYNGHYGIHEICDICPKSQLEICAKHHNVPNRKDVDVLANLAGLAIEGIEVKNRNITVVDSAEQQRYFMQHTLNFQVHDKALPHFEGRHGRAEIGWSDK